MELQLASSRVDFADEPVARMSTATCECMYARLWQEQRDKASETEQRLMSKVAELEAKVETLTQQLASKERKLRATVIKGRQDGHNKAIEEKIGVDDNFLIENESQPPSALEITTRALEISLHEINLSCLRKELLPSGQEYLPNNFSHPENLRCKTPEPALNDQNSPTPSPAVPMTPLQKLRHQTPRIQKTLVMEYLAVLNTATREELLQLKGIGPKRAAHVLEMREQSVKPFRDLQDVKIIGLNQRDLMSEFARTTLRP